MTTLLDLDDAATPHPAAVQELAAQRERTRVLARWAQEALGVLATLDPGEMDDGGEQLQLLRDRGQALVDAVLHGADCRRGSA